jgi:transposase-like protein
MSKPMGRPTKYTKEIGALVFDLMDEGLSVVQVARKLNVARSTIYKWAEDNDDFSDTFTRAREAGEAFWEYKFIDMMQSRASDSSQSLIKLYFANRFKWSEGDNGADQEMATPQSVQVEIVDARKAD